MNTISVDTPNVNVRETASFVSILITPTAVIPTIQIVATDTATVRQLGLRSPGPASGVPIYGVPLSSLPPLEQDAINLIADYFLANPNLFH